MSQHGREDEQENSYTWKPLILNRYSMRHGLCELKTSLSVYAEKKRQEWGCKTSCLSVGNFLFTFFHNVTSCISLHLKEMIISPHKICMWSISYKIVSKITLQWTMLVKIIKKVSSDRHLKKNVTHSTPENKQISHLTHSTEKWRESITCMSFKPILGPTYKLLMHTLSHSKRCIKGIKCTEANTS